MVMYWSPESFWSCRRASCAPSHFPTYLTTQLNMHRLQLIWLCPATDRLSSEKVGFIESTVDLEGGGFELGGRFYCPTCTTDMSGAGPDLHSRLARPTCTVDLPTCAADLRNRLAQPTCATDLRSRLAQPTCAVDLRNRLAQPTCAVDLRGRLAQPTCATDLRVRTAALTRSAAAARPLRAGLLHPRVRAHVSDDQRARGAGGVGVGARAAQLQAR